MKKLLVLLFSILISFNSYGEWTLVTTGINVKNKYYIDFDGVDKNNGYTYYWNLVDFEKLSKWGELSAKVLYEVDCNAPLKEKRISSIYYKLPMGKGAISDTSNSPGDWEYASPDSVREQTIKAVCNY
tara:strand:+ start:327 stop:710 length:384 start_codon:yes stop_codon:yes gene_type:complete